MTRDDIFLGTTPQVSDFEFNDEVAEVFDDMIVRSVPFYLEQQGMIESIGRRFFIPDTTVCDLGCSTATTLIRLCRAIEGPSNFVGYDNSVPMLERAKRKVEENGLEDRIEVRWGDFNGGLSNLSLENASVVTMCWTLQFVRPLRRDGLIRWIYDGLVEHGALIVTEKTLANDTSVNRFFIDAYYGAKRRNGYSEEEIMRKREALENVLVPYRIDENADLFRRGGFQVVETFFQWFNFAGFLCVKKPS